ncbi:hypothetical protein D3C71_1631400 [compost metagenome]
MFQQQFMHPQQLAPRARRQRERVGVLVAQAAVEAVEQQRQWHPLLQHGVEVRALAAKRVLYQLVVRL